VKNFEEETDLKPGHQTLFPRENICLRQSSKKSFERTKEPLDFKSVSVKNRRFKEAVMKTSNEKSEMPIKAIKPGKRIAKLKLVSPFDSISDLTLHYLGEYLENLITLQGLAFDFDSCQKITNKGLSNLCKGLKTPLLEKASDRLFQVLKYDYGCV